MRGKNFNWPTGLFVIIYHVCLAIGLPLYLYYYTPSTSMVVISIVLYFITGISITGGYHRLYSHSSYKAHPAVEAVILFFATMAAQGSALRWSFEHRIHHAFVDTDKDPYSIKKGFWYAHILWLFQEPLPIDQKVVSDLMKKPLLVFQHKYYPWCLVACNAIMFLFVGWLLNDYLGAFVISWWTRLFCLHHSTWCINSVAHMFGSRSFSQELSAVDNYLLSLFTFGEGYHNYHHTYATDYRNGIRWFHFDPTKWVIWTLNRFGLTQGLKRVDKYHIKERMIVDKKDELLQWIQTSFHHRREELQQLIATGSADVLEKIAKLRALKDEYMKNAASRKAAKKERHELKYLKKEIRQGYKRFRLLSKYIMSLKPEPS